MHPHYALLARFYERFSQRDHAGMIACYAPDVSFADPVFNLQGKRAGAMWHMLCEGGKDLSVSYSDISANDRTGTAHWEATYTFSASGRRVHNVIDAEFTFRDGRIASHRDYFDFWRWSRMALGPAGALLGWSAFMRQKVQRTAASRLDRFVAAHPQYQDV